MRYRVIIRPEAENDLWVERLNASMDADYSQRLREAIELKRKRRFEQALPLFQELLYEQSNDAYLLSNLSHLYFLMGDYKNALLMLERSSLIRQPNRFVLRLKAEILLKLDRREEAEKILTRLSKEEFDLEATKRLVKFYMEDKRFEEALLLIERALSSLGYNRDLLMTKGEVLAKMGNKDLACDSFKEILDRNPKDEFAYLRLITLRIEDKSADEVVKELETLLSIPSKGENAYLRSLLGRAYKESGRYDEAVKGYREAIRLQPDNIFNRKQLGFCLSRMGDYDGAIETLSFCVMEDPEDNYVMKTLISAFRKTGRLKEMLQLLDKLVSKNPKPRFWTLKKKIEKEIASR